MSTNNFIKDECQLIFSASNLLISKIKNRFDLGTAIFGLKFKQKKNRQRHKASIYVLNSVSSPVCLYRCSEKQGRCLIAGGCPLRNLLSLFSVVPGAFAFLAFPTFRPFFRRTCVCIGCMCVFVVLHSCRVCCQHSLSISSSTRTSILPLTCRRHREQSNNVCSTSVNRQQ